MPPGATGWPMRCATGVLARTSAATAVRHAASGHSERAAAGAVDSAVTRRTNSFEYGDPAAVLSGCSPDAVSTARVAAATTSATTTSGIRPDPRTRTA